MDVQYSSESYCAICDLYFVSQSSRAEHVSNSPKHPRCETCDRRFLNNNTLRNHYTYSKYHHYCASCRISFETAAGLRMHIEYASIHCDDSDDEDDGPLLIEGHEDELGVLQYPDEVTDDEDDDDDDSWEHYDDCDFEDEEDLGDVDSSKLSCHIEEDIDGELSSFSLSCPVCQLPPKVTCTTPCGHLFCGICIHEAYEQHGACPVCDEPGTLKQLRRLYISA